MNKYNVKEIAHQLVQLEVQSQENDLGIGTEEQRHKLMGELMDALGSYPVTDERRNSQRFPAFGKSTIILGSDQNEFDIIDLSIGGLAIKGQTTCSIGDIVTVKQIALDDRVFDLSALGQIAWIAAIDENARKVGIQYSSPDISQIAPILRAAYLQYLKSLSNE